MHFKPILMSTAAIGFAIGGSAAFAQEAPQTAHKEQAATPGDIIVTARKRQESILEVPVVASVLTQEALDKYQVADITHIAARVPGLGFGSQVLTIGAQVSLRGVGTSTLDAGVDQSVSLNIDGLQLGQGLAFQSGMFDLAQVEVLKGPQALFYGKNSPAGVISIRTADPGTDVEVIGRTGYELEADEWRNELILSGPLSDTFGLRLATMYSDMEGFYKNGAIAVPGLGGLDPKYGRFGGTKSLIMRGTAVWKPTPDFDARLKMNYTRDRNKGGAPHQHVSCPEGTGPVGASTLRFLSNDDCKRNKTLYIADLNPAAFPNVPNSGVPFMNTSQKFGTLELNYHLQPEITLTSVTGYYKMHGHGLINGVELAGIPVIASENDAHRRDITQELRLNSDFDGPFNFTAGGFYQDGKLSNHLIVTGNTILGLPVIGNNSSTIDIEAISAFGQMRWKVVPQLEIAGGVRYSDEKRTDHAFSRRTATPVPILLADPQDPDPLNPASNTASPKISSKNWSPELTLTYTPTDDLTFFGSLKQGYKSGSFSISRILATGNNASFGDERVRGGEIGLKTRVLDRSLFINLAGYHYIYKGLQVGVNEPALNGAPQNRTLNAGSAKVYGVDFDVTYNPPSVPELSLRAAINWNHARFTDLEGVPCTGGQTIAQGCNQLQNTLGLPGTTDPATGLPLFTATDLSGTRLVRAPDWQMTMGFDYEVPIGGDMTFGFGADGQYSSKYPAALAARPDSYQSAFAKINANVSLKGADDKWQLSLIGNNLTNKLTSGSCTNVNAQNGQILGGQLTGGVGAGPAGIDEIACRLDRGRETWVRLTLKL